jgi:3-oxoacyl-[acyl-carrier protein] reductase
MASEIGGRWGRLDVLVNNAGITRDGLLVMFREDDWDRVQGVNLTGPFLTTRACVPLMEKAGGGHIVNIASRSGTKGKAGQSAYSASKAGLVGLTFTAARELGPGNIRVNAVLPGYLPTDMGASSENAMAMAREHSALGRLADPAETASFIAWLVGTAGITGRVFDLDSRLENTPY